jgi:hypothetical protein
MNDEMSRNHLILSFRVDLYQCLLGPARGSFPLGQPSLTKAGALSRSTLVICKVRCNRLVDALAQTTARFTRELIWASASGQESDLAGCGFELHVFTGVHHG